MNRYVQWAAGLLAATGLAACGGNAKTPTTSVQLRVNASAITTLPSAEFYVSVDCGSYKATDLQLVQGVNGPVEADRDSRYFEATFAAVPVNVDCKFAGRAVEHQGAPVGDVNFAAEITRKFTKSESNPQVILVLQQQDKFTTYDNEAPQILGLTVSDNSVDTLKGFKFLTDPRPTFMDDTDSIVILNAKAFDPNGDPMKYKLEDGGKGGTFYKLDWDDNVIQQIFGAPGLDGNWYDVPAGGNLPSIVWIPCVGFQGTATLTLTIKDAHRGTGPLAETDYSETKLSVDVTVDSANAKRVVKFFGDLNHWPDILSIETKVDGSTGGQVVSGQPARIWAKVHDFDRDALHYTLTSDCAGEFRAPAGSTALTFPQPVPQLDCDRDAELSFDFIPAVVFADSVGSQLCTVTLTVDDYVDDPNGGGGKIGGAKSGTIGVNVVKVNPVGFGPDITLAYATAGSVGPGETVGFQVNALSRNPAPPVPLKYAIELIGIDLDPLKLGTFIGGKSNTTGAFSWRSPGDDDFFGRLKCFTDVGLKNLSETFYFRFVIEDDAYVTNGVPAVNYLVIPVDVECAQ